MQQLAASPRVAMQAPCGLQARRLQTLGCLSSSTPTAPRQQQQRRNTTDAAAAVIRSAARTAVRAQVFGSNSRGSSSQQPQQQPPGAGGAGPTQQQQIDLERLRQQGGYSYAPPRSQPQQQQQQPWAWDQQAQQQQPDASGDGSGGGNRGGSGGGSDGGGGLSGYTKALIAAAFVTGLGAGVYFDAEINLSPNQVASTEIIDRRTPNAEVCMAYGYSAMVFDQRVFVTYNPFNLYVTQPEVKPGCILRRSNFAVLEREELVTGKQVEQCKKRMNTFGFVGDLSKEPEVSCVYHSEEAENQYLLNPEKALQLGEGPPAPAAGGGAK